jgi:hypothetical protein
MEDEDVRLFLSRDAGPLITADYKLINADADVLN